MSKKYGIKKKDQYNWIIYSISKIKKGKNKGKKVEKVYGYYANLETVCFKFLYFKAGKKSINKNFNVKMILKEIKKAKKEIIKTINENKKGN